MNEENTNQTEQTEPTTPPEQTPSPLSPTAPLEVTALTAALAAKADASALEGKADAADVAVLQQKLAPLARVDLANTGLAVMSHYTGKGTYGADKPCSLTYQFYPYLVAIQEPTSGDTLILVRPNRTVYTLGGSLNVTWNQKTVSWYSTVSAQKQWNTQGLDYWITTIGSC